jgi:Flp pilus assembly protein TadD
VHQGIKHFKAGTTVEAFQCLNQALTIDPQNVEGLVARGKRGPFL